MGKLYIVPTPVGNLEDGDDHFSATSEEYSIMRIDITTGETYFINGIQ